MGIFDFLKPKNIMVEPEMAMQQQNVVTDMIDNSVNIGVTTTFELVVEDVFTISGRGTVITGKIGKGEVKIGDVVTIYNTGKVTEVLGIEMFRKNLDYAQVGDNVGILLKDVSRNEVERGYVIYK